MTARGFEPRVPDGQRDFRDDRVEIPPELARAVCVPNQSKHAARAIVAATGLPTLWTMRTSPTVEPYNPREQDSLARLEALAR